MDLYFGMWFFAFFSLALRDFNFRSSRAVLWNEASVSAAVDNVFLTEIVLVNESCADTRNADKKASWIFFFSALLP